MKSLEEIAKQAILTTLMPRYIAQRCMTPDDRESIESSKKIMLKYVEEYDIDNFVDDLWGLDKNLDRAFYISECQPAFYWALGLTDHMGKGVIAEDPLDAVADRKIKAGWKCDPQEIKEMYRPFKHEDRARQLRKGFAKLGFSRKALSQIQFWADRKLPLDDTSEIENQYTYMNMVYKSNSLDDFLSRCKLRSEEEIARQFSKYFFYQCGEIGRKNLYESRDFIMSEFVNHKVAVSRRWALQYCLSKEDCFFYMNLSL